MDARYESNRPDFSRNSNYLADLKWSLGRRWEEPGEDSMIVQVRRVAETRGTLPVHRFLRSPISGSGLFEGSASGKGAKCPLFETEFKGLLGLLLWLRSFLGLLLPGSSIFRTMIAFLIGGAFAFRGRTVICGFFRYLDAYLRFVILRRYSLHAGHRTALSHNSL